MRVARQAPKPASARASAINASRPGPGTATAGATPTPCKVKVTGGALLVTVKVCENGPLAVGEKRYVMVHEPVVAAKVCPVQPSATRVNGASGAVIAVMVAEALPVFLIVTVDVPF